MNTEAVPYLNGESILVAGRAESDLRLAKRRVSRPGGSTVLESDCCGICLGVACEAKGGAASTERAGGNGSW